MMTAFKGNLLTMEEIKYVFISHRNVQPDQDITTKIYNYLSEHKLAAWYDNGLRVGDWADQISKKLHGASAYILIASKDSLVSDEVIDEIGLMRQERQKNVKALIPFIIDDYFFNMEAGSADYFIGSNRNQAVILSKFPDEESAFACLADYLKDVLETFENNPDDFLFDETHKILKKYKGHDRIVAVPGFVREISENAFSFNADLEKVKIPSSVKSICKRAFFGCEKLVAVDGMTGIEGCDVTAFDKTGVQIDRDNNFLLNGVVFGGEPAPDGKIAVPYGARVIATRAFPCKNVKSIVFPDGLEHIGARAFVDCFGVEEVVFPASIKTVGLKAFDGCSALKSAVFEGKTPEGAENAFNNNVKITGGHI